MNVGEASAVQGDGGGGKEGKRREGAHIERWKRLAVGGWERQGRCGTSDILYRLGRRASRKPRRQRS